MARFHVWRGLRPLCCAGCIRAGLPSLLPPLPPLPSSPVLCPALDAGRASLPLLTASGGDVLFHLPSSLSLHPAPRRTACVAPAAAADVTAGWPRRGRRRTRRRRRRRLWRRQRCGSGGAQLRPNGGSRCDGGGGGGCGGPRGGDTCDGCGCDGGGGGGDGTCGRSGNGDGKAIDGRWPTPPARSAIGGGGRRQPAATGGFACPFLRYSRGRAPQ